MITHYKGKKIHYKTQRLAAELYNAMYTYRLFTGNRIYGPASTDDTIVDWLYHHNRQLHDRVVKCSNYWPVIESCVYQYADHFPQDLER